MVIRDRDPWRARNVFQKLLKAEADRRVRMCNLQSAKDCASVKTSLATVHARAQEIKKSSKVRVSRSERNSPRTDRDVSRASAILKDVERRGKTQPLVGEVWEHNAQ